MKTLVTGGGGFLGGYVVERLRSEGLDPFVARRAGMRQETIATSSSSSVIATRVAGSVACTPKSKPDITLVSANEAAKPIIAPAPARAIPCFKTILITFPVCAPRAMRTPISRVRSATVYDITP